MTKLRVGIDVDGVLADFNTSYKKLIEKLTPLRLPDISDYYPNTWYYERAAGISKDDENRVWDAIKSNHSFWHKLQPNLETFDFLQGLDDLSADIYFITSRVGDSAKYQTEQWLRHNGFIAYPTVLISKEKGLCCKSLKLTHYIDDKNENCTAVSEQSPDTKVFMLACPWNSEQVGIPRIRSVHEFLKQVNADEC